jgi:hypothetical protein
MRILMAGALVSGILYGAMPMKIYDHYRCGYDEKRGRIVIADIRDGKPVITQKLDPEIYRDGTDDGRKAAVYYRHVDFDGHRDFVLLSGRDEYTVYLYRNGGFVRAGGLGKLFGCCRRFERDTANRRIVSTYAPANSAAWNWWTYRERLFYRLQGGTPVLSKREVTDYDICTTLRRSTTYYDDGKKRTSVTYVAGEDRGKEVFFEAEIAGGKTLRICKNSYGRHHYSYALFDRNGRLLVSRGDMERATAYIDGDRTVMKFSNGYTLTEDGSGHIDLLDGKKNGDSPAPRKETTLKCRRLKGRLRDAFAKDEEYIRMVTDPGYFGKPVVNGKRMQQVRVGTSDGLMVVDDLAKGISRTFRVNVPCGGLFSLDIFWGNDRDILYEDDGEELVEINLATGQRRTVLVYDMIGPNTRMVFSANGRQALHWEDDFENRAVIRYIDLKSLKHKKIATPDPKKVKDFAFDKSGKYLVIRYGNGKTEKIKLEE